MHLELLQRIGVAAVLGAIIGYERDLHGRPVGLRTHLLVAMASATFMIVSTHFVYFQNYGKDDFVSVDASRIAASVVSGIGFLAGGAILRNAGTVQGLTTAAGLWLVTSIGLCAGAGMYIESGTVTLAGIIALTGLRRFEDKNDNLTRRHVLLVLGDVQPKFADIVAAMTNLGLKVSDIDYDEHLVEKKEVALTFDVKIPNQIGVERLIAELEKFQGVRRIQIRVPT